MKKYTAKNWDPLAQIGSHLDNWNFHSYVLSPWRSYYEWLHIANLFCQTPLCASSLITCPPSPPIPACQVDSMSKLAVYVLFSPCAQWSQSRRMSVPSLSTSRVYFMLFHSSLPSSCPSWIFFICESMMSNQNESDLQEEHHDMIWSLSSFEFQLICHMFLLVRSSPKMINWWIIRPCTSLSINLYLQNVQRWISVLFLNRLCDTSEIFLFCYVLLVTLRLFFGFIWSEKVLLLKVFFFPLFVHVSKSPLAFHLPSYHDKNISHEIFNLVSFITIFGDSVSSTFGPIVVKSRASSLRCMLKSTSGGLAKRSTLLYVQCHSLLFCISNLFVSWRCRIASWTCPDNILIVFKLFCPCVHWSWLHFTSTTCAFRCEHRDWVFCPFLESYSRPTAPLWVFAQHNQNICSHTKR